MYTFAGEVVLDPFIGSGQTAIAALKTGRHYVGYEIDPKYIELAEKRIRAACGQLRLGFTEAEAIVADRRCRLKGNKIKKGKH